MSSSLVPQPRTLNLKQGNVAENWRKFRDSYKNYEIATEYDTKKDPVRVALLLSVIGEDSVELYSTFEWSDPADSTKLAIVLDKFEAYCKPKASELFETYRFLSRRQEMAEPIDAYVTELRMLATGCKFADKDRRIRDQIVLGIQNDRIRERLLREMNPDLNKVIEIIRATEMAEKQLKTIVGDKDYTEVNKVVSKKTKFRKAEHKNQDVDCKFCGSRHERKKESCPAWGKDCRKCGKKNHFSNKCHGKKEESSSSVKEVTAFTVTGREKITKTLNLSEGGLKVTFLIDTGASVNILPFDEYVRITDDKRGKKLNTSTTTTIRTYGGKTWKCQGNTNLGVEVNGKKHIIPILVVRLNAMPLLSLKTSQELGLLKIIDCDRVTTESRSDDILDVRSRPFNEQKVRTGQGIYGLTKEEVMKRYADVFSGLGELEGDYHIQMDLNVKPVVHPPRRVPVAIRDELMERLDEMEELGVIMKITKPTKWVSSLMLKREPNKLRICLDPRHLNEGIMREHYPLPTVEEVTTRLKNAKVFSVVDAKFGFWQVKLDQESSELTTFNTPFGRYC